MADASSDSFISRWQLAVSLKQLREESGLTVEQAAQRLGASPGRWSKSKLSRIENRDQMIRPRELDQLLDLYELKDNEKRAAIQDVLDSARKRGWWVSFRRAIPERFQPFISMEAAAVSLRQYEAFTVPGLLQTPEYARALMTAVTPDIAADDLERRVALRLARQRVLGRDNPVALHAIIDESVLERPVGRPVVMRAQLRRLLDFAAESNATLQILRRSAGPHPGLEGPFTIVSLPEPLPDIGYAEGQGGLIYLESSDAVRECTLKFGILTRLALTQAESVDLVNTVLRDCG